MREIDKVRSPNLTSVAIDRNAVLEAEWDCVVQRNIDEHTFLQVSTVLQPWESVRTWNMISFGYNTPFVWLFPDMISPCSTAINLYWYTPFLCDVFQDRLAHW